MKIPAVSRFRRFAFLIAILGLVLVLGAGKAGPFAPAVPLPHEKLIDLHCHTAGIGAGNSGCFVSPTLRGSYKFNFYLRSFGVTKADLAREGDGLVVTRISQQLERSEHVGKAVVLALDGAVDANGQLDLSRTEIYVPNEFVATEVAKHPNLLFGASVNPYRSDALARLEWAKAHGAVLVKWLPSIQHVDPADPALEPYYRKLAELKLPLLTHTGSEHSFTRAEDEYCDPARLRLALRCGVTVVAAHAATPGTYEHQRAIDRLAVLMTEFPHLYADLSSLTQINKPGYLGDVVRRPEFRGRILYGTDYPLIAIPGLTTAWHYAHRLTIPTMLRIATTQNPWDRDVALKQGLGVPSDVFVASAALIGGGR
jgi:predicted TIM-barrel fold metal-dependent hydrolase